MPLRINLLPDELKNEPVERSKQYWREYYQKNKASRKLKDAQYRGDNRDRINARQRLARLAPNARDKEKIRSRSRRMLDGHRFEEVLAAQGAKCGICATTAWAGPGKCPHADHDHSTGLLRGALCHNDNLGIGNLGDSYERVLAAAWYLRHPPAGSGGQDYDYLW